MTSGAFFQKRSELSEKQLAANAAAAAARAARERERVRLAREQQEEADEIRRLNKPPVGRPRKDRSLVPLRPEHQMQPVFKPLNTLGALNHRTDWLAHPQLASMIFRSVAAYKSYKEGVRHLQQEHSLSGLFERLNESTVRGWFETDPKTGRGSFTILKSGVIAAMQRGGAYHRLKKTYPFIKLLYIPPGCTPVAQVLDTFCNRPFKCSVKGSYMNWSCEQLMPQVAAGIPASEVKLDLSIGVIKPLTLEWGMEGREHLVGMKEGIAADYGKIGTRRAITDQAYQLDCIKHAGRLFLGQEAEDASSSLFLPAIPEALQAFTDQPFPDMVEDAEAVPLRDVVAAMEGRVMGEIVAPLEAEDTDPSFMLPPPLVVPADMETAYEMAERLVGGMLMQLDAAGLAEAAAGKHRKKGGKPTKAPAAGGAVASGAATGEEAKPSKKRGRRPGSKNKPKVGAVGAAATAGDKEEEEEDVEWEDVEYI